MGLQSCHVQRRGATINGNAKTDKADHTANCEEGREGVERRRRRKLRAPDELATKAKVDKAPSKVQSTVQYSSLVGRVARWSCTVWYLGDLRPAKLLHAACCCSKSCLTCLVTYLTSPDPARRFRPSDSMPPLTQVRARHSHGLAPRVLCT